MDFSEVGYDDRDWINLAQDRDRWRAYVRVEMNLRGKPRKKLNQVISPSGNQTHARAQPGSAGKFLSYASGLYVSSVARFYCQESWTVNCPKSDQQEEQLDNTHGRPTSVVDVACWPLVTGPYRAVSNKSQSKW
ncbi:hypothetical protein ANN_22381 [Periplaneta americana]|uniref:Uncharacterized protein n=1 Tax=Periplaneta americana TaxID=6978 RepID=A0ABQ8S8G1_PERAM|nr:hypothetical protein ANN_22381 [Periplaneta americana]